MFSSGHQNNYLSSVASLPVPSSSSSLFPFHSIIDKEDNNNINRRYSSGSLYRTSGTSSQHMTSYSLSECENLDFNNLSSTTTTNSTTTGLLGTNYQADSGYQTTCYDGGDSVGIGCISNGYGPATGGSLATSHLPSQIPSRSHSPPPQLSSNRRQQQQQNYAQYSQYSVGTLIHNNNNNNNYNNFKSYSHDCQQASPIKSTVSTTKCAPNNNNNHHVGGLHISVNNDVNFIINKPERVLCLMNNLWEEEVDCAREWLEKLDWKSYENYQGIQEKIALMEEYYRKAFDMDAPSCDFMEECYRDVTSADTLLSMVESAWQGTDDEDNYINNFCYNTTNTTTMPTVEHTAAAAGGGIVRSSNNNNNPNNYNNQSHVTGPRAIVKTSQGIILPPTNILSVNKVSSDDLQSNGSSGSAGKPMQVHRRASKPKREDAYFNIRYKTQECSHYKKGMQCPAGDNCHFAHGIQELRRPTLHPKFKTQVCSHFIKHGICPYGDKCFFVHDVSSDNNNSSSSQ